MTTTTVDTQVIAAGSGGTSTPVKLTLQAGTESLSIQLKSTTVRATSPGILNNLTKNVQLYWAFSPEDLTLANVPTLLSTSVKQQKLQLNRDLEAAGVRMQVRDKAAGQYLYVWFEYPASVDQYTIVAYVTEFDNASGLTVGGGAASITNPLPTETVVTADASGLTKLRIPGSAPLLAAAQVVKASAGKVFGVRAHSPAANILPSYVKFFNVAAASVVVGTTVPVMVLKVPAFDDPETGQLLIVPGPLELEAFSTAISCLATSVLADTGAQTAPTSGLIVEIHYK